MQTTITLGLCVCFLAFMHLSTALPTQSQLISGTVGWYALRRPRPSCRSIVVKGLTEQLIKHTLCRLPGVFENIANVPGLTFGESAYPWLQPRAAQALRRATAAGGRFTLTQGLRSFPQSVLFWHWQGSCGISLAARPGYSDHMLGMAIDVGCGWCSSVKDPLRNAGFVWKGSRDVPHYSIRPNPSERINGESVRVFQVLWNYNHPNEQIKVDGLWTENGETDNAILRTPASGFAREPPCVPLSQSNGDNEDNSGGGATKPTNPTNPTKKPWQPRPTNAPTYGFCTIGSSKGSCIKTSDCYSKKGVPSPGFCPGPSNIQCCIQKKSTKPDFDKKEEELTQYRPIVKTNVNARMYIDAFGIKFLRGTEKFVPSFYYGVSGTRIIGFGHSCRAQDCQNIKGMTSKGHNYAIKMTNDHITLRQAEDILRLDIELYSNAVRTLVTKKLNQNQFNSLVSLAFNIGTKQFKTSTVLKLVNAGERNEAKLTKAYVLFNKVRGRRVAGLTWRRVQEARLYFGNYYAGNFDNDQTCYAYGFQGVCMNVNTCVQHGKQFKIGICPGGKEIRRCYKRSS